MTSASSTVPNPSGTADRRRFLSVQVGGVPIPVLLAGLVIAVVALMVALPGLAPHDPALINASESSLGPSRTHIFGTDQLGRDVFSRVVEGARTACLAPLVLAIGTVLISMMLGIVAGFAGRWVDLLISRFVDMLYSVPELVVAIVVVGVVGGGLWTAVAVLLVFGLPGNVRIFRSAVLERIRLPYIEAARTTGLATPRIILTQIVPAVLPLATTTFVLQYTYGLVTVSSLSFLGLGVRPGDPTWGRMLFENRPIMAMNIWAIAGPGLLLAALAISANVLGDWMQHRHERSARQR